MILYYISIEFWGLFCIATNMLKSTQQHSVHEKSQNRNTTSSKQPWNWKYYSILSKKNLGLKNANITIAYKTSIQQFFHTIPKQLEQPSKQLI